MKIHEIYPMIPDDEWLEILINIESNLPLQAVRIFRHYTGFDLTTGAKVIKRIAKEELNLDILTFIH